MKIQTYIVQRALHRLLQQKRPYYALGYDIPEHYEERYRNSELKKADTFRNRILTATPKFVQNKVSTFKKENDGKLMVLSTLKNVE